MPIWSEGLQLLAGETFSAPLNLLVKCCHRWVPVQVMTFAVFQEHVTSLILAG